MTSKEDADKDTFLLTKEFEKRSKVKDVQFLNGYNPSHLAGAGDLIESASQLLGSPINDYDKNTILLQIHPEITTRKILLVGHSQGTFYTNEIYGYITSYGEPKESVGVYNAATPAGYVSGGGAYITSENDKVINAVRDAARMINAKQPLAANASIPLTAKEAADKFGGHSFAGVYLAGVSGRMVSEITDALKKLSATDDIEPPAAENGREAGCFTPPPKDISYYVQGAAFAVADPTATGVSAAGKGIITAGKITYDTAATAAKVAYNGAVIVAQSAVALTQSAVAAAGDLLANIPKIGSAIASPLNNGLAVISSYFGGSGQTVAIEGSVQSVQTSNPEPQQEASLTNIPPVVQPAVSSNNPQSGNEAQTANNVESLVVSPPALSPSNGLNGSNPPVMSPPNPSPNTAIPLGPPIGGSGPVPDPQPQNQTPALSETILPQNDNSSSSQTQATSSPQTGAFPTINFFQVVYDFAPRFDFSWTPATDENGSTSTNKYYIYDITNPSSTAKIFETSSTDAFSYSHAVDEVGKDYQFKFVAEGADGRSNSTTTTIAAKSFLDKFYFYKNPKASSTNYLFDVTTTSSRPFWDASNQSNDPDWKAIVFYLNKDAPKQPSISTADQLVPSDPSYVRVSYEGCAGGIGIHELIFVKNNSFCTSGPLATAAYNFNRLQDARLAVPLASSTSDISFSPSDYVTLGFYDFGGGGGGNQYLKLAAVDKAKYYFSPEAQGQSPPTIPGDFSQTFSSLTGKVDLRWSSSTDADSLDYLITYQVNKATSSVLDAGNWQSNGSLRTFSMTPVFPSAYRLGVRSVDNLGNVSESSEADWTFPADYAPLLSQLDKSVEVAPTGHSQKFFITATTTIDAVALYGKPDEGVYVTSQSYIQIRRDNNDRMNGEVLGTSASITLGQYDSPQELIYTFASPIQLQASSSYWIVTFDGPSANTNGTKYYGSTGLTTGGSNSDVYPDGYVSNYPGKDFYFRLIKQ